MVADASMPPHHLVLLSPVERNDWYSANPAYARALAEEVLPAVRAETGEHRRRWWRSGRAWAGSRCCTRSAAHPSLFGAMILQSGSFFQPRYDAQESGFAHYRRITRFVSGVRRHRPAGVVPTVITCGLGEENLANNRDMAGVLQGQGYPVRLVEVPDAHNLVAWRDAWHPHLAELARQVWTDDRPPAQDT